MIKQLPAVILACACAILAYLLHATREENKRLTRTLAEHRTSAETSKPRADTGPMTAAANPPAVADANAPAPRINPEADEPTFAESSRRMMSSMTKMMENPTMNKMMEASQRGAVGALYSDLIEYLKLNAEETEYFMNLLMYRQMKQMDLAMKVMSGNLSEEEKQRLTADMKEAEDLVKTEMESFLNSDSDYAEFEFYEHTMGERMMLSQMDGQLAGSDAALSDETYRALLGMMHDEREAFPFSSDLSDQENMNIGPERFSKENLDRFAQDNEELYRIIIGKAQSMLTPEQLKAFEEAINTTIEMQRAQLEMAAQLFGGGEAAKTP